MAWMIRLYEREAYISLKNITNSTEKSTDWFLRNAYPEEGRKLRIIQESNHLRRYFTLVDTVAALEKSVLRGDIKSYKLLETLSRQASKIQIKFPIENLEFYDIMNHFENWVKIIKSDGNESVKIGRDEARSLFTQYLRGKTDLPFDVNRNFFALIIEEAKMKGLKIIKTGIRKNKASIRVYEFY